MALPPHASSMLTLSSRQQLPLARQALLPREHGAYFQLLLPLATALAVTVPSAPALWLTVAAVACFWVHEPLLHLLGHRSTRAQRDRVVALRWTWMLLGVAACALVLAVPSLAPGARPYLALPGILGAEVLLMTWGRQERTLSGELLASLALGAWAVPVALAGGQAPGAALTLWGTFALGFALATMTVHVVIRAHKPGADRALLRVVGLVVASAGLAGSLGWALNAGVSAWRVVALLPIPVVALGTLALLPAPRHLKRLGWSFAAASCATAVLLGAGLA
ncbi:YwiC-like family protein [Pyxidicoccus trucidator]|uniref:YwiC-like family protein n=1 Tax=Pyxidicoccus trucidator TaxID=2709662 RepID=UPI001967BA4E|nr:YwiC-like family protein [Pyxidicoccus trucidator]